MTESVRAWHTSSVILDSWPPTSKSWPLHLQIMKDAFLLTLKRTATNKGLIHVETWLKLHPELIHARGECGLESPIDDILGTSGKHIALESSQKALQRGLPTAEKPLDCPFSTSDWPRLL